MEQKIADNFDLIVQLMNNWSEQWQQHILRHGVGLSAEQILQARCVGVRHPEKVRILNVPNVPMPHYKLLHETFVSSNLFGLNAHGLSLMYGIFLKNDCFPQEYWLTHELVHVAQFERLGGLAGGMRQYLKECLTDGYESSALEREAHQTAVECLKNSDLAFLFDS